jgi:hypothetical protein
VTTQNNHFFASIYSFLNWSNWAVKQS